MTVVNWSPALSWTSWTSSSWNVAPGTHCTIQLGTLNLNLANVFLSPTWLLPGRIIWMKIKAKWILTSFNYDPINCLWHWLQGCHWGHQVKTLEMLMVKLTVKIPDSILWMGLMIYFLCCICSLKHLLIYSYLLFSVYIYLINIFLIVPHTLYQHTPLMWSELFLI